MVPSLTEVLLRPVMVALPSATLPVNVFAPLIVWGGVERCVCAGAADGDDAGG